MNLPLRTVRPDRHLDDDLEQACPARRPRPAPGGQTGVSIRSAIASSASA
jgi:hypothetical protein